MAKFSSCSGTLCSERILVKMFSYVGDEYNKWSIIIINFTNLWLPFLVHPVNNNIKCKMIRVNDSKSPYSRMDFIGKGVLIHCEVKVKYQGRSEGLL